ncbi:MAG: hypothetical protein MI864_16860, partial [Pseudomonadales bacterium]|nr:hypothetical protein [Pseudomonadales bacterium]
KFMHSNKESGYGSKDPNRSKSGYYQLRAVDLVRESEGYCPSGILVWFCDYKKFGCCDTDHHVARLFHRTKWSDIVESPGRYLSAQWDPLSVPAEIVYAPWDFGPFIIG